MHIIEAFKVENEGMNTHTHTYTHTHTHTHKHTHTADRKDRYIGNAYIDKHPFKQGKSTVDASVEKEDICRCRTNAKSSFR